MAFEPLAFEPLAFEPMAFEPMAFVLKGHTLNSPDWISNETLICSYDAINREFSWVTRPYELTRNGYNNRMKVAGDENRSRSQVLTGSSLATAKKKLRDYLENNTIAEREMTMTDQPSGLPPLQRRREGKDGLIIDEINLRVSTRLVFMPDFDRDIRKALDVSKEAAVAHYARFFTLPQFAVLATAILKAQGEPQPLLYGWAGSIWINPPD
eukprot:s1037_g4.t1